jgi:hypothetical protein
LESQRNHEFGASKITSKITATKDRSKRLFMPHVHFIKHFMYMTQESTMEAHASGDALGHTSKISEPKGKSQI